MQSTISTVTPRDFSTQVEYSWVTSRSSAAAIGVLKKSAKLITGTFLVHNRHLAVSLFKIILDSVIFNLRHWHACWVPWLKLNFITLLPTTKCTLSIVRPCVRNGSGCHSKTVIN